MPYRAKEMSEQTGKAYLYDLLILISPCPVRCSNSVLVKFILVELSKRDRLHDATPPPWPERAGTHLATRL